MEITYEGGASFSIKGERVVVINPKRRPARTDIVVRTERVADTASVVRGPGEYEIGGVLITTVTAADGSLVHAIDVDDGTIVHVGSAGSRIGEQEVSALGSADVLLLNSDNVPAAMDILAKLTPRVVIPFGRHVNEICAAVGVKEAAPLPRFAWNGRSASSKAVLLQGPVPRKRTPKHAA